MAVSILHLRDQGLGPVQAQKLAADLVDRAHEFDALRSFSLSYNPDIGGVGILAILDVLPPGVSEVGLVGCGLCDDIADSLVAWVSRAPNLQMICIEGNDFGTRTRTRLAAIKGRQAGLTVIV